MEYQIHIQQVESQPTAVVRCRARLSELPTVVPRGCGEVWGFVRASGLPRPGRNLALYLDCEISGEINLEVGVEVTQPFAGNERVVCSSTPAGTVATAAHLGSYHLLGQAHTAIRQWCAAHGYALAGPNWEVYGHWTDDPAKLRTDMFCLLQGVGKPT